MARLGKSGPGVAQGGQEQFVKEIHKENSRVLKDLLGEEIAIFIKRSIKEMMCFKRGGQIQESGPGAPWTGDSHLHIEKY